MGTRKGVAGYWNGRNGPEAYPTKKIKPKKKKKKIWQSRNRQFTFKSINLSQSC